MKNKIHLFDLKNIPTESNVLEESNLGKVSELNQDYKAFAASLPIKEISKN
jgi:hypothetical protein